jgi:hypothetical protein
MQADQDVYEAGPAARFKHGAAAGDSDYSQGKIYGGSEAGIHERIKTQDLKPGLSSSWSRAEVLNWPNAISLARLLSGPLLVGMILQGFLRAALVGLALAGASDWLDGFVARKLGISSVLGSYLDPLADKVCCLSFLFSSPFFPSPIFLKSLQS